MEYGTIAYVKVECPYCDLVSMGQVLLPHGIICDVLVMLPSSCQSQDFFLLFRLVGLLIQKLELEDLIVKYTSLNIFWRSLKLSTQTTKQKMKLNLQAMW